MKTTNRTKKITLAIILISLVISFFPAHKLQAASAALSINKSQIEIGETVKVSIGASAPVSGYVLGATVKYNSTVFTFKGFSNSSGISTTANAKGGVVSITGSDSSGVNRDIKSVGTLIFEAKESSAEASFTLTELTIGLEGMYDAPSKKVQVSAPVATTAKPTAKPTAAPTAKPTAKPTPKPTEKPEATKTNEVTVETTVETTIETTIEQTSPPEKIYSFDKQQLIKAQNEPEEQNIPQGFLLLEEEDSPDPITYVMPGTSFTLFWLEDAAGAASFYYYDYDQDVYVPYKEISYPQGVFRIGLPKNAAIPEGFVETTILLSDQEYPAFRPDPDRELPAGITRIPEQIYLLYLEKDVEAEGGGLEAEGGFYYYDLETGSIFPYAYLPIVIPEKAEPEPTEPAAAGADPLGDDPDAINAEVASLANLSDNYRNFSLILALLLVVSWLIFWFTAPKRKLAKARINPDRKTDAQTGTDNNNTAAIPSQSSAVQDAFKREDGNKANQTQVFAEPDYSQDYSQAGESRSEEEETETSLPWYVQEEEKPSRFGRRLFSAKAAQQDDKTQTLTGVNNYYPEDAQSSGYQEDDGGIDMKSGHDELGDEPDSSSYSRHNELGDEPDSAPYQRQDQLGGETDFVSYQPHDELGDDPDSAPYSRHDDSGSGEGYNDSEGETSGFIWPDEPQTRQRFNSFRQSRIEQMTDTGSFQPLEQDDQDDIFGDRGEI